MISIPDFNASTISGVNAFCRVKRTRASPPRIVPETSEITGTGGPARELPGRSPEERQREKQSDAHFTDAHGGHVSPNNESWADVFGTAIPRCFHAAGVATLPRGVRLRKPRWMRNGS